MSSAAKTPNLALPQWTASEKPERTDFNAAFTAIDTAVPLKANAAQGSWLSATLQNGWTGGLLYRLNSIGQIEMYANLTAGTVANNTIVAVLPHTFVMNGVPILAKNQTADTYSAMFYTDGVNIRTTGLGIAAGNVARFNVVLNRL